MPKKNHYFFRYTRSKTRGFMWKYKTNFITNTKAANKSRPL